MKHKLTIYPAIDLLDGKCVRLFKGDYAQETVYERNPLHVAKKWHELGADFLHIVDLDGAKTGEQKNLVFVKKILKLNHISVQLGGGIRDIKTIEKLIHSGVKRVILGTAAIKDKKFAIAALKKFGAHIVLGMDCGGGKLAIDGWQNDTQIKAIDYALELKKHGLSKVIYTDIERDGTLMGPNFEELEKFANKTKIETIASGGISSINDIVKLNNMRKRGVHIEGVIVGKALYARKVKLDEILNLLQSEPHS